MMQGMLPLLAMPEADGLPVRAAMTLRDAELPVCTDKGEVMRALQPRLVATAAALAPGRVLVTAEQTHGDGIAVIDSPPAATHVPVVDGLITASRDCVLGIAVADCCPVWLWPPGGGMVAVVHAGRKGAELGIAARAAQLLAMAACCPVAELGALLGPCIRPPHYEVDIPALLHRQLAACGVVERRDCGLDTAADLQRFYSYRSERGRTGRMMAFGWIA